MAAGRGREAAWALAFTTGVLVLSTGAVLLRPEDATTALWWPAAAWSAAGVLLADGVRARRVAVLLVAVATTAANAYGGRTWPLAVAFGLCNALEAAVIARMMGSGPAARRLVDTADLARLVRALAAGAALIGLGAGLAVAATLGGDVWSTWRSVSASHASALLLLLPLALRLPEDRGEARLLERSGQALLLVVLVAGTFGPGQHLPVSLLPGVAVVWAALRCGTRTTVLQLLLTGLAVSAATLAGWGPYAVVEGSSVDDPLLTINLVQVFVVVLGTVCLSVASSVQERRDAERALRQLALTDPLTGLANRRVLDDHLNAALERAARGEHGTLLLVDLDGFKPVNDRLGHDAGDEVLRLVAARLLTGFRKVDTVVRLGGDEFAVLCPGLEQGGTAWCSLQDRVQRALDEPYELPGGPVRVGASSGWAAVTDGSSCDDMLRAADLAMYEAKRARRATPVPTPRQDRLTTMAVQLP